jgi:hypothetical protein
MHYGVPLIRAHSVGYSVAGSHAPVVQQAEATDLKSVECGFESHREYQALISQLVEETVSKAVKCRFESD